MSDLIESELAEIASKIKGHNQRMRAISKMALTTARQTGDLLIAAKAMLPHGQFSAWVAEHCEITDRYSRMCMEISREWSLIEEAQNGNNFRFETVNDIMQFLRDQRKIAKLEQQPVDPAIDHSVESEFDPKPEADTETPAVDPSRPVRRELPPQQPKNMVRSHCGPTENPTKISELEEIAEIPERSAETDPVHEIMDMIAKLNARQRDELMDRLDPHDPLDPDQNVVGETAYRLSLADPDVKSQIDEALELEHFGDYPGIAVQWILDALEGDCQNIGLLIGEARIRFAIETLSSDAVVAIGYLALGAVQTDFDLSGDIDRKITALEEIFGLSDVEECAQ